MPSPRIGAYNILIPRADKPDKGSDSWFFRCDGVVQTILDEFEIVGLQECSFGLPCKQGEFVTDKLTSRGWETYNPSLIKNFQDVFHERLPIFWKPEVFTLENSGQFELSGWSPEELASVPILEKRYASFIQGRLASGRRLLFFTLHLQHQTKNPTELEMFFAKQKREEAQVRLLDAIRTQRRSGESVIVAGDFNTPEVLPRLETSELQEVSRVAKTRERWECNSFHDWNPQARSEHIDRIFVSSDLNSGIARIGDSLASDHFPVSYQLAD